MGYVLDIIDVLVLVVLLTQKYISRHKQQQVPLSHFNGNPYAIVSCVAAMDQLTHLFRYIQWSTKIGSFE